MDIDEAFRHAIDGDALLFLGAGFSLGARNQLGEDFPLSTDLSTSLMRELGETETVPLQIASELYAKKMGEVGLLAFLNQKLGVSRVAAHHRSFAKPNWRRIYTTNYDAVFETAGREEGRRVRPLNLTPRIPPAEMGETDCIHINGFLPYASARNLSSTLILSETAYLTTRFVESQWAALFRGDVEAARAVVFAGYSLSDLDIARLLVAVESIRRKCVFVVRANPSTALKTTIAKFGTIAALDGVEEAAKLLEAISGNHRPALRQRIFSSFLPFRVAAPKTSPPSAQDVFDLFVKGEVDTDQLARSLVEEPPSYAIRRREIGDVVEALKRGAQAVVILSRLANGKTVFAECTAARVRDRYDIFFYSRETLTQGDEIRALRAPGRPTLIVVDDYVRHIDVIRELRLGVNENQQMLLTSRTPSHLTARERLQAALGSAVPLEFRVDTLREAELVEFDSIVAAAGLLGETAALSAERRLRIYQEKGEGELGGILLWLLDSRTIRNRLAETFATLQEQSDAQRVVIAAMALTHIGQTPDIDDIAEFIGASPINRLIFSEDSAAADLIRFDRRGAYPRSSLFAVAALRALWDRGHVPEILQQILRRAWELRFGPARFRIIARDLMRYSKIRQIVPTDNQGVHIQYYYDLIRNMPSCINNQLFWLQFALADIERKDFQVAEHHLEQSFAIASKMVGFDTYQIDNVKAQFLLAREIHEPDPERSFRSFVEASKIIGRQMRDRAHAYYPYRVASRYGDFWRAVATHWNEPQKSIFLTGCKAVYDFAQAADRDLAEMDDVRRCKEVVQTILMQTGRLATH